MPVRHFISGGSTGLPKSVVHDALNWAHIITDTAFVLRELGVTSGQSVLIAQPSFPWDIASVFAEAASLCEADVICYGLLAFQQMLAYRWIDLSPEFIVAPTSLILQMIDQGLNPKDDTSIIIVGEPLSKKKEDIIRSIWNPKDIRRVYGNALVGTIGYQYQTTSDILLLNPRFSYTLQDISDTQEGILIIHSRYTGKQIETQDTVQICTGIEYHGLWKNEMAIRILGRSNAVITLRDGSHLHEKVFLSLRDTFNATDIQCEYCQRPENTDTLLIRYSGENYINEAEFIQNLIQLVPDLENEYHKIDIQLINCPLSEFKITVRGKTPVIIQEEV